MKLFHSQDINSSIIVSNDSTSKKIRINKNTNFADFYSEILKNFPFLDNLELFYFEGYMKEKFIITNEKEYIIANKKGIEYFYLSENKQSSDLLDYIKYYSVILFSPVKILNKEFQINDRKKMQMKKLETINEIDENNINGGNNNINNNINYNNIFIEENFLEKKIEDIKDSKIKKDLKKLISDFPLEEEYYIKSTYYSCDKDYEKTHKYLYSIDVTKNLGLKSLLNSKIKDNYNYNSSNKPKKDFNKNKSENQERRYSTLKKILENKAINWKLEDKNINVNDYIALRNRLYKEARNFFAAKNYKTGQSLMNRAKRLTQEIEEIAKDRGLNKFFENYKYNSNNKEIDIHGLHVKESKTIINSKIKILRQKKIEDNLKSIDLTIITGTGSHSEGGKPVLYPELLSWLKNKNNIKVNGRLNEGVIFITIY